jgi:hypothetical protein
MTYLLLGEVSVAADGSPGIRAPPHKWLWATTDSARLRTNTDENRGGHRMT